MSENAPEMFVWTSANGDTMVGTSWLQETLPDPLLYAPPVEVCKAKAKRKDAAVRPEKPAEPPETTEAA